MTLPRLGSGFGDPGGWTHGIVGGRRKWGLRADDALDLTTWLVMATEPLEALLAVGGVATLERTRLVVDISGTRRLRTGLVTDVVASASALFEE